MRMFGVDPDAPVTTADCKVVGLGTANEENGEATTTNRCKFLKNDVN